jgi:alkanesulfonate monooxygenase SsuD/methylene tetrahydromethanopterin reductase-like flavin-dependent oxidoreductase (luciferase family)
MMPAVSGLQFGIHAPPEGKDFDTMKTLCQTAERLNYDLFTVTDRLKLGAYRVPERKRNISPLVHMNQASKNSGLSHHRA